MIRQSIALSFSLLASVAAAQGITPPVSAPTSRAVETTKLFDHLMTEYDRLLVRSKDRFSRSLIIVCIARVPRADATAKLLQMAGDEKDPLVRAVAWEALLARASMLSADDHKRWASVTAAMAKADVFRGKTRGPALNVMATAAPDKALKDAWAAILNKSAPADDSSILTALADCLTEWRSRDLVDVLLHKPTVGSAAEQADHLLRMMGSPVPPGRADHPVAFAEHARWWAEEKRTWKEKIEVKDGSWRGLEPQFIAPPGPLEAVDPDAAEWQKDLELKAPNLPAFDVAFVMDATGSMDPALRWLKRDVGKLLKGFGAIALEPRIGLTFYRDQDDQNSPITRPMTGKLDVLTKQLRSMTAEGGGDEPEAVLDGLRSCYERNKWATAKEARKVVVLVGDAPPKPRTQAVAERLVKEQAAKGFRLYALKCAPGLPEFDALAAAGNGVSIEVRMDEIQRVPGDPLGALRESLTAPPNQLPVGLRLLNQVLVDVINPQYRDRIEPVVMILWEMVDEGPGR